MHLKQNTELQNGKYRIIRVLGQGGFGITYLAENILLGKEVAIKEFFPKDFCGRDATSHLTLGTESNKETVVKLKVRFIKEARNIAKLDHPGIVKVFDVFEENDTAYYVMEYIHGNNLNEIVKKNGPLPEDKAVKYITEVGEALEYIHSKNMTHFDVKPANIIIREKDDFPVLIDFGLSKQYDSHGDATSTLMQAVSNGYSPIELYNVGSVSEFSPQTDVYSLAATLYFLLTAILPPIPTKIMEEGITFPSTVNNELRATITKGLSINRNNRHINIRTFCNEISNKEEQTILIQNLNNAVPSATNNTFDESPSFISSNQDNISPNKSIKNIKAWIIISLTTLVVLLFVFIFKDTFNNSPDNSLDNNLDNSLDTEINDNNKSTEELNTESSLAQTVTLEPYGPFSSKSEIINLIEAFQSKAGQRIIDTSVLAPNITTDFGRPVNFTRESYASSLEDYWTKQHFIEGNWNIDWNSLTLVPQEDGGIIASMKGIYTMVCEKDGEPYTRVFQCDSHFTFNKDRQISYYREKAKKINEWFGY